MDKQSDIIIGNGSPRKFSRRAVKRILLIIVAMLLVGTAGYAAYGYLTDSQEEKKKQTAELTRKQSLMQESQEIGNEINEDVATAVTTGNASELEQIYDSEIAGKEGNTNAQAFLYLKKALDLRSAGAPDQKVFDAALQAERLDTAKVYEFDIYPLLGYTAYKLGQKQAAIDYLNQSLEIFKLSEHTGPNLIKETEDFIKKIEEEL